MTYQYAQSPDAIRLCPGFFGVDQFRGRIVAIRSRQATASIYAIRVIHLIRDPGGAA